MSESQASLSWQILAMEYIHDYIEMKASKYMSDKEKKEWGLM